MRIRLADHYGIIDWLIPAIDDLQARGTPLTPNELSNMDLDYALKLFNARRDFFTDQCKCNWEFRQWVPPTYEFVERRESLWSQLRNGPSRALRHRKTH